MGMWPYYADQDNTPTHSSRGRKDRKRVGPRGVYPRIRCHAPFAPQNCSPRRLPDNAILVRGAPRANTLNLRIGCHQIMFDVNECSRNPPNNRLKQKGESVKKRSAPQRNPSGRMPHRFALDMR